MQRTIVVVAIAGVVNLVVLLSVTFAGSDVPPGSGYWLLSADGEVHAFGGAVDYGSSDGGPFTDLEPHPGGSGYWILGADGVVSGYGGTAVGATVFGSAALPAGEQAVALSSTPAGDGYWVFTDRGRVFAFGAAQSFGDLTGLVLNGPVLDSVATPSGLGYYLVASDGGVFAFGDARFVGSMGGQPLNEPVRSLVPDPDGIGYWLVSADGGVFAFDAPFVGSVPAALTPGHRLNAPVLGMVPYGSGYLMVATDGGVFNFSDLPFHGSMGADPPRSPVVAVAAMPSAATSGPGSGLVSAPAPAPGMTVTTPTSLTTVPVPGSSVPGASPSASPPQPTSSPPLTVPGPLPVPTAPPPTVRSPQPGDIVVDTVDEIRAALSSGRPGDVIRVADGEYEFKPRLVASSSGTTASPIVLLGSRRAVLRTKNAAGDYGLHITGDHWRIEGLTIAHATKGIVLDGSVGTVLDGIEVYDIGAEAIHFRACSSDGVLRNSFVHHTGRTSAQFGEGVYVGSANSNWSLYECTDSVEKQTKGDNTERVVVEGNVFEDVTAEGADLKEGTDSGVLRANVFRRTGTSGQNSADSAVDAKGNNWLIEDNIVSETNAPWDDKGVFRPSEFVDGYQTHSVYSGYGTGNVFRRNRVDGTIPGFAVGQYPSAGNVVMCDNVAVGAAKGLVGDGSRAATCRL